MSVELPLGWVLAQLEDLTRDPKQDIVDGPFGSNLKASEYVDEGAPIVRLQNIDRNRFLDKNIKCVTSRKAEELSRHSFISGDIIITKLGEPVGKACLVPCTLNNGIIVADVVRARMDENRALRKYVSYAINSPIVVSEINLKAKGSTRPRVNLGHIRELEIPLAPHREQQRIVAKLEKLLAKVDACKERLEKIPAILKRFRQSVLAAAFGGILTSDWRSSNTAIAPAAHLLKEIEVVRLSRATTTKDRNRLQERHRSQQERVENPSSEPLPNTWTECTIGSIGDVQNGSTPSRKNLAYWNGKIPWVSSGEVRNTEIFMTREQISEDGFKNSSVRWLPSGTVLLAMIGEGKTRGQSAILRIKATINQNIAAVVTDHGLILSKYLWYWFQYQYSLTRLIGSGSGPKALNCQLVRCMPLNLAPLEEQHEIVRRVEALFKIADDIEKRYEKAKAHVDKLTQSILAKAFRGELVPQDPNDEPASELLKRIQEERKNQKAEARPNRKSTSRRVKN